MDDDNMQLEALNYEEAKQYLGGVVFVSIMMTLGIIGNVHVVFVYAFRMKPSNHRIFILFLGGLDLITCLIGMPFIIVDLRNPLKFTMATSCKVHRFVTYYICSSSVFILTVIAIDRYRKICVYRGKQISLAMAKTLCILCLCISVVLTWPAPVLYGHSSVNTTIPNVIGTRCFIEDRFVHTDYSAYFNLALLLFVSVIFCILVVLYTMIARRIRRHAANRSFGQDNSSTAVKPTDLNDETLNEKLQGVKVNIIGVVNAKTEIVHAAESSESSNSTSTKPKFQKSRTENKTNVQFSLARRTTFMMSLVTAFFFISYFPHLLLQIITFTKNDFVTNMTFTGKILYNTFLYCVFINNMVNCFIYGFCDRRFRKEIKTLYGNVFRRGK